MNETSYARIKAHLSGDTPLTVTEWKRLLEELAGDIKNERAVDRELVTCLLDAEPHQIDGNLDRVDADLVLRFVHGSVVTSAPAARIRQSLVARAGEVYGTAPARDDTAPAVLPHAWERLLALLRPAALVGAGALAGLLIGLHASRPAPVQGPSIASAPPQASPAEPVQLAALFPGYSPESYPVEIAARSFTPITTAVEAALWFDRRDGAYSVGDRVTIGYRVTARTHGTLVELSADGRVRAWPLPGAAGGAIEPGGAREFPSPPGVLEWEGPAGPEDLLLVVASVPLPEVLLGRFLSMRPGSSGAERTALLEEIRDVVRAWARGARADVAFARARAMVAGRRGQEDRRREDR